MQRLLAGLSIATALTIVSAPVWAQSSDYTEFLVEQYGVLGKSDAKHLLDLVADIDSMLADTAKTVDHLASIAPIDPETGFATDPPTVDGVLAVSVNRQADVPANVIIDLLFENLADRNRFLVGLENTLGLRDSTCSSIKVAHFLPEPGRSVSWWTLDFQRPEAQLEIHARDPLDANCTRSMTPKSELVDEAQLKVFFERLRDDPPPLGDADAFTAWVEPYGKHETTMATECDIDLVVPSWSDEPRSEVIGLSGINFIQAKLEPCAAEYPTVSYVSLNGYLESDMFGMEKAVAAATELFGKPNDACAELEQMTWPIGEKRTLMVTSMYRGFAAILYDTRLRELGCGVE